MDTITAGQLANLLKELQLLSAQLRVSQLRVSQLRVSLAKVDRRLERISLHLETLIMQGQNG